jgi:hypothetical protein
MTTAIGSTSSRLQLNNLTKDFGQKGESITAVDNVTLTNLVNS